MSTLLLIRTMFGRVLMVVMLVMLLSSDSFPVINIDFLFRGVEFKFLWLLYVPDAVDDRLLLLAQNEAVDSKGTTETAAHEYNENDDDEDTKGPAVLFTAPFLAIIRVVACPIGSTVKADRRTRVCDAHVLFLKEKLT